MRIGQILRHECLVPDVKARDKAGVLAELAERLVRVDPTLELEVLINSLLERESLGSTGIGDSIAIPHSRLPGLRQTMAAFGRSGQGVEFDSLDGKPVHLIFLLVAPEHASREHLLALARISRLCQKESLRSRLMQEPSPDRLYQLIVEEDGKL